MREQALVSRGEKAMSLCFPMIALPESDIPGELSHSIAIRKRAATWFLAIMIKQPLNFPLYP